MEETLTCHRMDFITRQFHDTLRNNARSDKLISARDISGYIQMVLAPELAAQLIMEDMTVGQEKAREIMAESAELGELLHGSVNALEDHDDASSQEMDKEQAAKAIVVE
jgi:hypothetical protein